MNKFRGLVGHCGLAALLIASSPVLAQDNSTSAAPAATQPAADIGPRELSNFSLSGTVTREAQPQPAEQQPAAAPPREPATRTAAPATSVVERPAQVRAATSEPRPIQAQPSSVIDPIPGGTNAPAPAATRPITAPAAVAPVVVALPAQASSDFSPLPWIAAILLLAAGAAVYFGLQRRGRRYEAAGVSDYFEATPEPASAPVAAPRRAEEPLVRRPEPQAPPVPSGVVTSSLRSAEPAVPAGVVASSLRPWIELELEPSQATLTEDHAAIAFDVTIFNSGSAPARDVAVEACMINAGDQQDAQLGEFYTAPSQVRDKIPAVAPMARITLKSAVRLPRASVREYEVEGRKLFMPMVALNSRYRWSSGEGQSAASFLVGGKAANDGARLSPLRLDQGKRGWKALAARRYEKGIRS
ncbi:hypothetical protein [Sphingomonas alba]|uniref:Uncharacterized protein n=1 Tax=Sphingomonas alba TaxID=2908208 RepID=A0ABT0RLE0_9SPHN|nr:hypothetical protein [Sphingomonas alba]MCL6683448.1 hypothetical protein [Sphingomonas alba]